MIGHLPFGLGAVTTRLEEVVSANGRNGTTNCNCHFLVHPEEVSVCVVKGAGRLRYRDSIWKLKELSRGTDFKDLCSLTERATII